MKARPACGLGSTLEESMEHCIELKDFSDLLHHLQKEFWFWHPTAANVTIQPWGWDERIGWDTYLVCIDGKAAMFTDGRP